MPQQASGVEIQSQRCVAPKPTTSPVTNMADVPEVVYVLANHPTLIAIPIVIFATLALWSRSNTAWLAPAARTQHPVYELGMKTGELCSGTVCLKRSPLYEIYPLLAILSLVVLVQVHVQLRDKPLLARVQ
jgi:hypothetical protein